MSVDSVNLKFKSVLNLIREADVAENAGTPFELPHPI
jgi:hypothetical protein